MSELISLTGADFAAAASHQGTRIALQLSGTADNAAMDPLDTVLTRVHAEARRLEVADAVIDLRGLEFMSSSCFKSFVTWIADIQELPPPAQYKLKFLSDPARHWQKRSLHALRCFAVELITVET
jgi:hypothetical protein